MFKLVIEDDEGNKTVVPIIRDEITIGRQDGNTIRLTERNVSRKHARLVRDDDAVFLEEVSARYGTRKNGERIDGKTEFSIGDVFTIGDYRLTLQSEVAPEAKKPKKPNGASGSPAGEFSKQPTKITSLEETTDAPREGTEIIATDPAKLVIVSSNFAGQEFPLARKEMVIGRGEECDIIIDHRSVSQKHAKIIRESGGEYKIIDLKSKNGVKVGGEEYRAVHLKRGDIVELGHVKFRFVEPGENYEFTPHSVVEEFAPASGNRSALALVGVFILAVAAVGGFMMFGGEPTVEPVATKTPEPTKTKTPTPPPDEPDESKSDEAVEKMFEEARELYREGKVSEAIGALEMVKKQELSPEMVHDVDDLLSRARLEKPLQSHFDSGRLHFNNERWVEALRAFQQIPPNDDSNIYRLLEDEDYKKRAIDHVFEDAIAVANEGETNEDFDAARQGPEAVLDILGEHEGAVAVLDQIEQKRDEEVKVPKQPPPRPKPDPKPDPKPKQKPKNPDLVPELVRKARMANYKGDYSVAIKLANEATYHGCGNPCQKILAIAYKLKGDTARACKYHRKAGLEIPADLACE